jgi:hypothetical protein
MKDRSPLSLRRFSLVSAIAVASWLGCGVRPSSDATSSSSALVDTQTRELYPAVDALYTGDRGIYRGCGPNNGVCHNSREFPNLATVGSLVENIGLDCNQKRDDPTQLDDLCERRGDLLRAGDSVGIEIAWLGSVASDPSTPRQWTMKLKDPVPENASSLSWSIVRATRTDGQPNDIVILSFGDAGVTLRADPSDAEGRTAIVAAPPLPPATGGDDDDGADDVVTPLFAQAGVPGNPQAIQVGDPNRNGTFGATLGGKLIAPGNPSKSYLLRRLVDPNAGPLMPRANCCFWTKQSLRALWCWVAGLAPDGKNALAPIAYDRCPEGPPDTVVYPEPGPTCETSGMCPVQPKGPPPDGPTFASVFARVLQPNCSGCHAGSSAPGGLDFSGKAKAYASLTRAPAHVIAGKPEESVLFVRISPDLCGQGCSVMPKGQPSLDDGLRSLVKQWIQAGTTDD